VELGELRRHWEEFGNRDPLWAVLAEPHKEHGGWDPDAFFLEGRKEIGDFFTYLAEVGHKPGRDTALDFGCGVGRLTQALCRHFRRVTGIDIAASMIAQARQYNSCGSRCQYLVNQTGDLRAFAGNSFDLVYSNIVLQHMEPRYFLPYLREFIRVLKRGGALYFQLPAEPSDEGNWACPAVPLSCYQAELSAYSIPTVFEAGGKRVVQIRVRNTSPAVWPVRGKMRVRVGNHWKSEDGETLAWDDGRNNLKRDVPPGGLAIVDLQVRAPESLGRAVLEFDMVQEHCSWFNEHGSAVLRRVVDIVAPVPQPKPETRENGFVPVMELYGLPPREVRHFLRECGARVLDIRENGWAGPEWRSYQYLAVKG